MMARAGRGTAVLDLCLRLYEVMAVLWPPEGNLFDDDEEGREGWLNDLQVRGWRNGRVVLCEVETMHFVVSPA